MTLKHRETQWFTVHSLVHSLSQKCRNLLYKVVLHGAATKSYVGCEVRTGAVKKAPLCHVPLKKACDVLYIGLQLKRQEGQCWLFLHFLLLRPNSPDRSSSSTLRFPKPPLAAGVGKGGAVSFWHCRAGDRFCVCGSSVKPSSQASHTIELSVNHIYGSHSSSLAFI